MPYHCPDSTTAQVWSDRNRPKHVAQAPARPSLTERPTATVLVLDSIDEVAADDWDALAGDQPFVRHAFLRALEVSGCATARTGWRARHLTLWQADVLIGALPLYEKSHSRGEYVFDWAWADAYARYGERYYPKLLCGIPFSPIPGCRLLARDAPARRALADALMAYARQADVSSLHILFPCEVDAQALEAAGLQMRHAVQFHWQNAGWPDFETFLDSLVRDKRKKIRQERRRVRDAGIEFRRLRGPQITEADWQFFMRCYGNTYHERGQQPYLNLAFFLDIARTMPENLLLFVAERAGRPIAAALNICDAQALYGRYWGELEHVPLLHFEACYYQGIEWCIDNGIGRFEGGAQGEHKLARGLLPVRTTSAHWVRDERFADAVQRYLERETVGIAEYFDELEAHAPFRTRD